MHRARNVRSPRRGFTLIELLVVISIIAVLVGLLLAGVMKVFSATPRVTTSSELGQLGGAIASFKQEFGVEYIPSTFVLREDQYDVSNAAHRKAVGYLSKVFGKNVFKQTGNANLLNVQVDWNGSGGIQGGDMVLSGEQCLVFFLGGIPRNGQCTGFSKDPGNPALAGGQRIPPFFQFKTSRLTAGTNGFFMYQSPYVAAPTTYYAYFAAGKGGAYEVNSAQGATPYRDNSGSYVSPDGFQIICAGADGRFGVNGTWTKDGTTNAQGVDDQANFSRGLVGATSN